MGKVKRICDELGVSPEEARCYLKEFDWNLASAMEACRQKLSPLDKKSTAAESSSSTPVPIISPRISKKSLRKEVPTELKKVLTDRFREVVPNVPPEDAVRLLQRFNWDVHLAVNYVMEQGDSVNRFDSSSDDEDGSESDIDMMQHEGPPLPLLPSQSQFEVPVCYPKQSQVGSSVSGSINVDVAETGDLLKKGDEAIPPKASSELQIQESSIPAQIREEELLPPFKVDRICDIIGVCREEALYYLEGFNWDLASAMEACRNKTLPPVKVKSSPGVSMSEKPASPEWNSTPSAPVGKKLLPPGKVKSWPGFSMSEKPPSPEWKSPPSAPGVIKSKSRQFSNEMRIHPEQLPPPERQKELIQSFCDVTGASAGDAVDCLNRFKWNGDDAVGDFLDKRFGNLKSQRISEGAHSTIGQSSSQWHSEGESSTTGSSKDVASKALASERKTKLMNSFCDVTGASRADAVACLNRCKWNESDAIGYFMDGNLDLQHISEAGTSKALASEIPPMGLPSQSQLQARLESPPSLMNIDPTKTEESHKEASSDSVTVAITPMRSSPMEEKLKGKAVEEDSGIENPDTITIDITFPDNTKVNMPFRSDQTLKDIRNAVEALRPDYSRDYYFMSRTCEDYKDLNTTVGQISTRGSTSLMQIYH